MVLSDNEVGAQNVRKLVALYASQTSAVEVIHGLVDRIMTCVQIKPEQAYAANSLTADEIADRKRHPSGFEIHIIHIHDTPSLQ